MDEAIVNREDEGDNVNVPPPLPQYLEKEPERLELIN